MQYKKIEQFIYYLQDKIEECYKHETEQSIKRFLEKLKGSGNDER